MPSGQTLDSQSQVLFLKLTTAEIDCSLWISNTSLNLDLLGSDYSNTHTQIPTHIPSGLLPKRISSSLQKITSIYSDEFPLF